MPNSPDLFTPAGREMIRNLGLLTKVSVCAYGFLDEEGIAITDEGALSIINRRLIEQVSLLDRVEIGLAISIGAYMFRGTNLHASPAEAAVTFFRDLRTARMNAQRSLDSRVSDNPEAQELMVEG